MEDSDKVEEKKVSSDAFKSPREPARRSGAVPVLALPSGGAPITSVPSAPVTNPSPRKGSQPPMMSPDKVKTAAFRSDPGNPSGQMRMSMSKSDVTKLQQQSARTSRGSPKGKGKPLPQVGSIYSPRWILSVKRETDKQVKAFLESLTLPATRDQVSAEVLDALEAHGNSFLRLRIDQLGESSQEMVRALQRQVTSNAKEKKLVVQLMLAISSCSRLDSYIESVREAEKVFTGGSRHGYDGQMEYYKTESPRLRDSANKRANFLSQSLDADNFEAVLQLLPQPDQEAEGGGRSELLESGVLCRICETMIEKTIYEEHVKFCKKKVGHDIEVIAVDQQLESLCSSLPAGSKLRSLLDRAQRISALKNPVGGFYECMALKKELSSMCTDGSVGASEEVVQKARDLIHKKMISLQQAERAMLQSPRLPSPKMNGTPTMERKKSTAAKIPSIHDFEILKPITRGGFGGVYLARKRATNDLYAIKALNRKEMKRRGELKAILAERNILATVYSEHVVKMYFAMASKRYLFLVMEYMPGGDCFTLLRKFGRFDENVAKFYIAEVVLALEDIHRQGIIHRDLKPDNILIGANGHVKLADFGLSAVGLINKQARDGEEEASSGVGSSEGSQDGKVVTEGQVKGTPHYIAPEILLGLPHDSGVDWWALGVMLFEFCNGYPPFDGDTVQDIFSEIFSGNIRWPSAENDEMSPTCHGLIARLLENDPEKRLNNAVRVKAHPFFADVDWLSLPSEEAPYVPQPTSDIDTSAFDERVEFFPMSQDTRSISDDADSSDEDSSDLEDEDDGGNGNNNNNENTKTEAAPTKANKTSLTNFWHVSVHNLAALK